MCLCVCACCCLFCDNMWQHFLQNRLTKKCDLLWLRAILTWLPVGRVVGRMEAVDLDMFRQLRWESTRLKLKPKITYHIFSCYFDGPYRHSPASLNTECHSFVCPRKGINISGGQKVRQLSKSVWPVGQLQTWRDWLLGVDGKSSAKVGWWSHGKSHWYHLISIWMPLMQLLKNGNWIQADEQQNRSESRWRQMKLKFASCSV